MIKLACAFLLFTCLVAFATAAQGVAHCFDKSFSTQVRIFELNRDFIDTQSMAIDYEAGLMRIDALIKEGNPGNGNFTIFNNYNLMARWVYDANTKYCFSEALSQPLHQICLSSNATYIRSDVIGGSLKVDLYEDRVYGFSAKISFAPNTNIPVNIVSKSTGHGVDYTIEEYFNWSHQKPSPSVFVMPAVCQKASKMRSISDAVVVNKIMTRTSMKFQ